MYTPDTFREDQLPLMHDLMRQYSFALLATADDNVPTVTHLPVFLLAGEGEYGTLYAHLAKANPQWKHFENQTESLVVFQGPHAYISPNWYADNPSVPTWNYAAVHAYGVPHILEQGDLLQLLQKLTTVYEQDFESPWSVDSLPEPYLKKMLKSIVRIQDGDHAPGWKMENEPESFRKRHNTCR